MGYIENGNEIARKLSSQYGWANNPIAAFLGNVQQESTINPASFQGGADNWSLGVGLVQWSPGTDLRVRAQAIGRRDYLTIDCQLAVIDYERRTGKQYIPTSSYHISFDEFIRSNADVAWLTTAWLMNYERAEAAMLSERKQYAQEWAGRISGQTSYVVESAVSWAIGIANDNSHGYDQGNRDGPDYDCSSLIAWAYFNAGLDTRPGYTPATGTMYSVFMSAGFNDVTRQVDLESGSCLMRGDVLLKPGNHTAMYVGEGQLVEASQNESGGITGGTSGDQTGKEIGVHSYYNFPWTYVLRYPESRNVSLVSWIPG